MWNEILKIVFLAFIICHKIPDWITHSYLGMLCFYQTSLSRPYIYFKHTVNVHVGWKSSTTQEHYNIKNQYHNLFVASLYNATGNMNKRDVQNTLIR